MDLYLDQALIDVAFVTDAMTMEEALRQVQVKHCDRHQLVIGIRCDGKDVSADAMAETMQRPANSFERIDLLTCAKATLVGDTMRDAADGLSRTEQARERTVELLQAGVTVEAAQTLGDCLRIWQQIHDAIAQSIELLGVDPERSVRDDASLLDLIGRPKAALLQVRDALRAQDYVLLADILQYEFAEVVESWQTIISLLRSEAEKLETAGHDE